MSVAVPAFAHPLLNSVMAPLLSPPSSVSSKIRKPVTSRPAGGNAFCGKRSVRSLRRSIMLLVAIPFVPAVAGVGGSTVRYSYEPRLTKDVTGQFIVTKRGPVKLILGPWTHGQRSVSYAGDVDFGPAAPLDGNVAPDYTAMRTAWFDRHLRGLDAPEHLPSPVKIFVMGGGSGRRTAEGRLDHGGRWRDEMDWPLPDAQPTAFHLQGDGSLATKPSGRAADCMFLADPLNPVPTIGGAIASGEPLMVAGAFDQRETAAVFGASEPGRALADRPDVLVFQTPALTSPLEVTGPIKARLWVSSSAVDTDITVKLIDVHPPSADYPQGYAMNLTHGLLRLRFRDSFEQPVLMTPHEIYEIEIEAFPTSNLFAAGHRIRLDIASSNFPHFDVNPNTGAPAGEASTPIVAHNVIHLGPDRPSRIVLPIVPERGG